MATRTGTSLRTRSRTRTISRSGSIVVGLDPKHPGAPLGLTGDLVHQMVSGQANLDTLRSLNDLFIGINGKVGLGYDKAGFNFSLDLGQGTAISEPTDTGSLFAFRAETVNPYHGTPLEKILQPGGTVVADGYFRNRNDFHCDMSVGNSLMFGVLQSSVSLHLGNDGVGLEATA